MKAYKYVKKYNKITEKDLTTFININQYNKKYYPNTYAKTKENSIQEEFDNAIYNGKIKKAVSILIKYHFEKFFNLLKK